MHNYPTEQNDIDENQMIEMIDSSALSNFISDEHLLDFMCTIRVTKITIPSEISRNEVSQRFTLNKNQKAAFMIITGHLDGMNKINEGNIIKKKMTNSKFIIYLKMASQIN